MDARDARAVKIKQLIENSGKSYVELEKATGIAKSSLQRYASGTTAKNPLSAIEKISAAFGVSPADIMGWEKDAEDLTDMVRKVLSDPRALRLVEAYMSLDDGGKEKAEAIIEVLAQSKKS